VKSVRLLHHYLYGQQVQGNIDYVYCKTHGVLGGLI